MVKARIRTLTTTPAVEVSAAMYIRMSTERQVYSPDHQRQKILEHASALGLVIVAEYLDAGKSGLTIRCRPELRRLLASVLSGAATFSSVLVYDVSRWGRFQDIVEADRILTHPAD